ncbi:MAG: PepSY domain-containing protein [Candidatus Levyibacteriota bacterium]
MEKKLILPVIALAAVGIVGSVYTIKHSGPTAADAQTASVSPAPGNTDKETVDDTKNEQKPTYKSSIQVADTTEQNESNEQKQLAGLAKISTSNAKSIAEKNLGGTASEVKLENDNGNVVYTVTVGSKEVKIDAGNGKVLQTETADGETNDGNSEEK